MVLACGTSTSPLSTNSKRDNRVGVVTGVRPDSRFGVIDSRTRTQGEDTDRGFVGYDDLWKRHETPWKVW